MGKVLGVDLGLTWAKIGSATLSFDDKGWIDCRPGVIEWPQSTCDPAAVVNAIVRFALDNDIRAISLDGPQGWRDPGTPGSFVGRDCDRLTRTPGKAGTYGVTKPGTWIRWIRCSIQVYDCLLETQHAILANSPDTGALPLPPDGRFYVLECFPTSTWRRACLNPLPGHRINFPTIQRFARDLRKAFGLPKAALSHDQSAHDNLQAVVAALPAAGLLGAPCRAVANGLPARMIAAHGATPVHRAEGIIWDAVPIFHRRRSTAPREAGSIKLTPPASAREPKASGSLIPGKQGVERGVRLFNYLVEEANRGNALGISYGGFIAYLHGVEEFGEIAGRKYLPSYTKTVILIASNVTLAAGGRKEVARSGRAIRAGMDTFIWRARSPFDRPVGAFRNPVSPIPYTRQQWLSVFPDGARRLITAAELRLIDGRC